MYNIALSFVGGFAVFLLTGLWLGPIPAVVPGLLVTGVTLYLLARRIGQLVEAEMAALVPLMQERKVDEALRREADRQRLRHERRARRIQHGPGHGQSSVRVSVG